LNKCPVERLMSIKNFTHGAPYNRIGEMRRAEPVCWEENRVTPQGGHWNVFGKQYIDEVMKHPEVFSNSFGPHIGELPAELSVEAMPALNLLDPPQHSKQRTVVDHAFKPSVINAREQQIRDIAKDIIDGVIDKGRCEFVNEVAALLPMRVICSILGVPEADQARVVELTNTVMLAEDPKFSKGREAGFKAQLSLIEYGESLAADHRVNPRETLTMETIQGHEDKTGLSDRDYGLLFLNLIEGGLETTRNSTAFGLYELIKNPDQYELLQREPQLIPDAVEEILRYQGPTIYYTRTAVADYQLADKNITKGEKVVCWLVSANRDEQVFADPDRFDIQRCQRESVRKHYRTFGVGRHFCIGVHLARMQLKVMFEEIVQRMDKPQLISEPEHCHSIFVDGFNEMHIKFEVRQ